MDTYSKYPSIRVYHSSGYNFFRSLVSINSQFLTFSRAVSCTFLKRNLLFFTSSFQFNFVGKLLGPKGNSLKRLQEETMTKMAILGRGSMRDRHKVSCTYFSSCFVIYRWGGKKQIFRGVVFLSFQNRVLNLTSQVSRVVKSFSLYSRQSY